MCAHCNGRGIRCTEWLIIVTASGRLIPCNVCGGKGYRIFEEFSQEEFLARFKNRPLAPRSL
jgi:hypothetical protein